MGQRTDAASCSLEATEGRKGYKPAGQGQEEATDAPADVRAEVSDNDDDVVSTQEVLEVLLVAQPAVTDEVLACIQAGIPWKRVRGARVCVHVWAGGWVWDV